MSTSPLCSMLLYSMRLSGEHAAELEQLIGKQPEQSRIILIENAADVVPNSQAWLGEFRLPLQQHGFQLMPVDLRAWAGKRSELHDLLASADCIWLGGGNTFYLRWLLQHTGADHSIQQLVRSGTVYAGWSAGAVVAGPVVRHFEHMGDNPADAPVVVDKGLGLLTEVVVPHIDHPHFAKGAAVVERALHRDGIATIPLGDTQALVVLNGDQRIVPAHKRQHS